MTVAPGNSGKKRSPLRLIVAAIAFVTLVCVGISVVLHTPKEEDYVQDQVNSMIRAFEKVDFEKIMQGVDDNILVTVDGSEYADSKPRLEAQMSRFFNRMDKVSITPGEMKVKLGEDNTTQVEFPFKHSSRYSSLMQGDAKKTPEVKLRMFKKDQKWLITRVELSVP